MTTYEKKLEQSRNRSRKYYQRHKEVIREKSTQYYYLNKDKRKTYWNNNKDRKKILNKRWRDKQGPSFRLANNIRRRISHAICNGYKSAKTMSLLGCDITTLKQWLQESANKNGCRDFDINNYSGYEYHIDHIIPCSAFNLSCSYHQKLCFHYTNLQMLKAEDNLIKSNKVLI